MSCCFKKDTGQGKNRTDGGKLFLPKYQSLQKFRQNQGQSRIIYYYSSFLPNF